MTAAHPVPEPEDNPTSSEIYLTAEVWDARLELAHIRQAAWSRGRSPDAVLAATLARLVADTRHTVRLPAIVGAPVGLTILAALAGPPGTGKSTAARIASELVPAQLLPPECDGVPPGSGEGFIELLFDNVREPDPENEGKLRNAHRQTRHNAYVYVDEGEVLAKLAGRQSGSTLLPNLRTAFTSGVLGQANASQDRKRIVPAGQAVYGVVLGIQPELAGPLFDEAGAGTPQRILWASTTAPTPPPGERPDWPGTLPRPKVPAEEWASHEKTGPYTWHEVGLPDAIALEVAERDHERQLHGADALDEHQDLIQLKVSAALALLEGRLDLEADDWELAARIVATSKAVRAGLADHLQAVAAEREQAAARRLARRQVEAVARSAEWHTVDTALHLAHKVRREPDRYSPSELRRSVSVKRRDVFEDALEHAIGEGWIVEREEPGQGTDRRRLHPGDVQP